MSGAGDRARLWALAGLAALLAGAVVLEVRPAKRVPDPVVVAAPRGIAAPSPGAAAAAPAGREEAWVAAILARPLFSPTRRPSSAAIAASRAAAPAALPRIAGILVDGERRSVIFAGSGKPVVVAEGGEMNGFRVQAIAPGEVTVLGPDGARTLRPSFDPHPPAPVAAPVAQGGLPGLPGGLPGLAGLPGGQGLIGIPGLTAPAPPAPSAR